MNIKMSKKKKSM